jgi:hypothetical protein
MEQNGESAQAFLSYQDSVHGRAVEKGSKKAAVCTDCHGAHEILPASDAKSPISKASVPGTCGKCHTEIENTFNQSIHGQAIARGNRACAGVHGLPRHSLHQVACRSEFAGFASRIWRATTCARCHEGVRLSRSLACRGTASQLLGQLSRAGGGRRIGGGRELLKLPRGAQYSAFERSALDHQSAHLDATCGKCHKGVTQKFTLTKVHMDRTAFRTILARSWCAGFGGSTWC